MISDPSLRAAKSYLLADPEKRPVHTQKTSEGLDITFPQGTPVKAATVLVIKIDNYNYRLQHRRAESRLDEKGELWCAGPIVAAEGDGGQSGAIVEAGLRVRVPSVANGHRVWNGRG